jgi:hypothetical protein
MIYPLATITARNLDEPLTGRLPVRDTMSKHSEPIKMVRTRLSHCRAAMV